MSDAGAGHSVETIFQDCLVLWDSCNGCSFTIVCCLGFCWPHSILTRVFCFLSLPMPWGPDRQYQKHMVRFEKPFIDETAPRSEFAHHNPILSQLWLWCNNLPEAPNIFQILWVLATRQTMSPVLTTSLRMALLDLWRSLAETNLLRVQYCKHTKSNDRA
jgi:hypothetical protein